MWATIFCNKAISGTTVSFSSWTDFITEFETSFKHHDMTHMVKSKKGTYKLSLVSYTHIALTKITDANILIGYYLAGIPAPLMTQIMSMETIPVTINAWYKKAISFQIMMDHTMEIHGHNANPSRAAYH